MFSLLTMKSALRMTRGRIEKGEPIEKILEVLEIAEKMVSDAMEEYGEEIL